MVKINGLMLYVYTSLDESYNDFIEAGVAFNTNCSPLNYDKNFNKSGFIILSGGFSGGNNFYGIC